MTVKKESEFQRNVKNRLRQQFEGCIVLKNDPTQQQGIPDLLVLYRDKWAALEVKKSSKAAHRPNQDFYVDRCNDMSYASFIFPENEDQVFEELEELFK